MDIVDLLLAILHHLLVFTLAGLLAVELALVRPGLSAQNLSLVGRIDGAYGGVALAVILVGICRVIFGLKGWEYYLSNHAFWGKMLAFLIVGLLSIHAFWGKMLAFLIVGLLSIRPTMRILAWRRNGVAPDEEVQAVRSWIKGEVLFLALVLVFAAAMARGIGA